MLEKFFHTILEAILDSLIFSSKRPFVSNESHPPSDMAVRATKNQIKSYRMDEGTSVTLEIASPTEPIRVETKSVDFTFCSLTDPATSVKECREGPRQAYTAVEYLNAEQRLQVPHHLLSKTNVEVAALMPGHNVVLNQYMEDSQTHGSYVSHCEDVFFVHFWIDDGENCP